MARRDKMFTEVTDDPVVGTVGRDARYESDRHDLGPWIETPQSSRVSRYRYDYMNDALQVQWRNNKNQGYVYFEMDYEQFRNFAKLASKGRGVNSHLNQLGYREMTADEVSAPSNLRYRAPSRAR